MKKALIILGCIILAALMVLSYVHISLLYIGSKPDYFSYEVIAISEENIKIDIFFTDSATAIKDYKYYIKDNKLYFDVYTVIASEKYNSSIVNFNINGDFSKITEIYTNNKLIWEKNKLTN